MKFKRSKKYQYGGSIGGVSYSMPVNVPLTKRPSPVQPFQEFTAENLGLVPDKEKVKKSLSSEAVEVEGLTSDVNNYYAMYNSAMSELNSLSELDILTESDEFKRIQQKINYLANPAIKNEIANNAAMWEESEEIVSKRNSQASIVTMGSSILVKDKSGKVDYVSYLDYANNKKNYTPVQVSSALSMRMEQIPGANNILQGINQTESLMSIKTTLEKGLTQLGSNASKKTSDGIAATASLIGNKGFSGFKEATENNTANIEALNTAYNFLSETQKTILRRAAIDKFNLTDPEEIEKGAYALMVSVFSKAKSSSYEIGFKSDDDLLFGGSGSGSDKREKIGFRETGVLALTGTKTVSLLDGNLESNMLASVVNPFYNDTPISDRKVDDIVYGGTIEGNVPYNRTWYAKMTSGEPLKTMNGDKLNAEYVTISENDNAVVTYLIEGNGQTINPLNSTDPKVKEFDKVYAAEMKKLQAAGVTNERQIRAAANKKAKEVFGSNYTYKPVLMTEAYVMTEEVPENQQAMSALPTRHKKQLSGDEQMTQASVIASTKKGYETEYQGAFDYLTADSGYKTVVMVDLPTGYAEKARLLDKNKLTISEPQSRIELRQNQPDLNTASANSFFQLND